MNFLNTHLRTFWIVFLPSVCIGQWTNQRSQIPERMWYTASFDSSTAICVGFPSTIYFTTNGGTYWFSDTSISQYRLASPQFINANIIRVAGGRGTFPNLGGALLESTDMGLHWSEKF